MRRFVIGSYLLLVSCDTPILHACDAGAPPDAVVGSVDVYDGTGRVDMEELSVIMDTTRAFARAGKNSYQGLSIGFVPAAIPWIQGGEMVTVNGYYDPNIDYIEVNFSASFLCILDTALIHELLHKIEFFDGKLYKPQSQIDSDATSWLRYYTEICP